VLDLEPIKERLAEWRYQSFDGRFYCQECALDGDVADLIAEVELLREIALGYQSSECQEFHISSDNCRCGTVESLYRGV
jgi:hypothetical protein